MPVTQYNWNKYLSEQKMTYGYGPNLDTRKIKSLSTPVETEDPLGNAKRFVKKYVKAGYRVSHDSSTPYNQWKDEDDVPEVIVAYKGKSFTKKEMCEIRGLIFSE